MMKTIALVLALAVPTAGCLSSAQKTQIEQVAKTCAEQDLDQILAESGESLLTTVMGYLAAGPSGWEAGLIQLGLKYGPDAIGCAVQVAEAFFDAEIANAKGSAAVSLPATGETIDFAQASANAKKYLADHPITLAK